MKKYLLIIVFFNSILVLAQQGALIITNDSDYDLHAQIIAEAPGSCGMHVYQDIIVPAHKYTIYDSFNTSGNANVVIPIYTWSVVPYSGGPTSNLPYTSFALSPIGTYGSNCRWGWSKFSLKDPTTGGFIYTSSNMGIHSCHPNIPFDDVSPPAPLNYIGWFQNPNGSNIDTYFMIY